MRPHSFLLSVLAVLLVGALAAGMAAGAVVSPRTGETFSAGVCAVPSVLGQTAEEVLFYPWSLYDSDSLQPLPEDALLELTGLDSFLRPFLLLDPGLDMDTNAILSAMEWAEGPQHLFLNEFPARTEDNVPITLSFAISPGPSQAAYSYLIRPARPRDLTEAEHAAALSQVEADLRSIFLTPDAFWDTDMGRLLSAGSEGAMAYSFDLSGLLGELSYLSILVYGDLSGTSRSPAREARPQDAPGNESESPSGVPEGLDLPLESLLPVLETYGCTVQLIDTAQQVVVLVTLSSGSVLGVYYDVQLGRYSGYGVSA